MNREFLEKLIGMQGSHEEHWGAMTLAESFDAILTRGGKGDVYQGCEIAKELQMQLRRYGAPTYDHHTFTTPVLPSPRLVRNASFTNVPRLLELDLNASHADRFTNIAASMVSLMLSYRRLSAIGNRFAATATIRSSLCSDCAHVM